MTSDQTPPPDNSEGATSEPVFPQAQVSRRHFSMIWLIPIIAALLTLYLGVRSYLQHGPYVTISFKTAEGLSAGQTPIKYKAVTLGTIEDIRLKPDGSGIIVHVQMLANAKSMLTDNTRFWIMKPRLDTGVPDLQSLVSGTYIQLNPGDPGGSQKRDFVGLETPPDVAPDEVGTIYALKAPRLGPIGVGSPVYYHDINVGKVMGYDIGDGFGGITVKTFVRAPFDKFVRAETRFWNASGLSVHLGSGGLSLELQSLPAIISGGVAFDTPRSAIGAPQAAGGTSFVLYDNRKAAEAELATRRISCVTYVRTSIKDLTHGSPVEVYGITVGQVTDVKLVLDSDKNSAHVRIAFDLQPDRAFGPDSFADTADPLQITRKLIANGMRVHLVSSNLIVGQEILSLEFAPKTSPADIVMEGDAMVLPAEAGGSIEDMAGALSEVAGKLNQIPFDEIGTNLNHLLQSADKNFAGPEMTQSLHALSETLANAAEISRKTKDRLDPALDRLPEISSKLQEAVTHANAFLANVDTGYGADSDFNRSAKRAMDEVNDAARSIRLLADFLDRHPEALIQGKVLKTDEKEKP